MEGVDAVFAKTVTLKYAREGAALINPLALI